MEERSVLGVNRSLGEEGEEGEEGGGAHRQQEPLSVICLGSRQAGR